MMINVTRRRETAAVQLDSQEVEGQGFHQFGAGVALDHPQLWMRRKCDLEQPILVTTQHQIV